MADDLPRTHQADTEQNPCHSLARMHVSRLPTLLLRGCGMNVKPRDWPDDLPLLVQPARLGKSFRQFRHLFSVAEMMCRYGKILLPRLLAVRVQHRGGKERKKKGRAGRGRGRRRRRRRRGLSYYKERTRQRSVWLAAAASLLACAPTDRRQGTHPGCLPFSSRIERSLTRSAGAGSCGAS